MILINELLDFNLSNEDIEKMNKDIQVIENNAKIELQEFSKRSRNLKNENDKKRLKKDIQISIKKLERIKESKTSNIFLSSFKIVAGAIIIIPGSILAIVAGLGTVLLTLPVILSGIVVSLLGATVAYGTKLIKQSELEDKTFTEVLDIQINANKKILNTI